MSGNCGTALGLWIKNRGEKKKQLLLERRSLSLPSSAIPGAGQGLPSLPRDTTEPASAASAQNAGSTCTPCSREGGGAPNPALAPPSHIQRAPEHPAPGHVPGRAVAATGKPKGASLGWEPARVVQRTLQGHHGGAGTARGEEPPPPRSARSQQPLQPHGRKDRALQAARDFHHGLEQAPRCRAGNEPRLPRAPSRTYLDFGLPWMCVCKHNGGTGSVGAAACWNKGEV